jgi:hypothetical protein
MIRVPRRVEILEQALLPLPQAEPQVLVVQFVNQEREVVSSLSVELPTPVHTSNGRRWRTTPWRGGDEGPKE